MKKHIHFIGIGGISMSGLAEILFRDGDKITGSDWTQSEITKHLTDIGIDVKLGNDAAHISPETDLVVHTAAVKPNNPELAAARALGIPTIDRAQLLGKIMQKYQYSIAVAGTHGKTTTTAIVSEVLLAAQLDPTISIGGVLDSIASNYRVGASPYFVLEACEYFDSFLQFFPHIGIILNIDEDHLDYFGSFERLKNSFRKFAENIKDTLIIHAGIPFLHEITAGLNCNIITYGTNNDEKSQFTAKNLIHNSAGLPEFSIYNGAEEVARCRLKLRGGHNIDNSLAAAAVADVLGISPKSLVQGLQDATGAKRRFEHKGIQKGVTVVDDYAHHPTEIKATLEAARQAAESGAYKRILCAFQSHTYSRTQNLLDEFAASFEQADIVLVLPIYASREVISESSPNHLSEIMAERINGYQPEDANNHAAAHNHTQQHPKKALFLPDFETARDWLAAHTLPGDLVITMGAGDINLLAEMFVNS